MKKKPSKLVTREYECQNPQCGKTFVRTGHAFDVRKYCSTQCSIKMRKASFMRI